MLPEVDGCFRLLSKFGRLWLKDAAQDPAEAAALAWWLDMTPAELQAKLDRPKVQARLLARPGERACPVCGAGLGSERRPHAVYCSETCRRSKERVKVKNGR